MSCNANFLQRSRRSWCTGTFHWTSYDGSFNCATHGVNKKKVYIAPNIRLLWHNVCQVWSAADGKRKFLLLASVVDGNSIPASPAALTLGAAWRKAASISSLTSSADASAPPDGPAAKLTSVYSLCSWSVGDSTQLRLRQVCLFSLECFVS